MNFATLIAGTKPLAGGFALTIPPDWHQGRTAYGGLTAALALCAAQQVAGHGLPPLRSAAVSFVGPAYGDVEVRARVLRRGKNATWIGAEVTRTGEVVLSATFVFMGPVASSVHLNHCPPPEGLIACEQAKVFHPHPMMPICIASHFDLRFALPKSDGPKSDGPKSKRSKSEDKRPELSWWARLKQRSGIDPMQELLLIADCLPPGVQPLMAPATPVSSMIWQANLLTAAPITRDGWWLLRSAADYAENGCSSQVMRFWNADGEPIMAGMQSIALFG